MRSLVSLLALIAIVACTSSVTLGPVITCSGVTLQNKNGECDLVPAGACSDGSFYEVNCGDDSTCTCVVNGNPDTPVLAANKTSGFCATLTVAMMHDIAALCVDTNTKDTSDAGVEPNLNIVTN
jgi:hypothetical protein